MNKTRIAVILITIVFLVWMGYLLNLNLLNHTWTFQMLKIGPFAIFETFTLSIHTVFFWSVLLFGIFILPFIFYELNFLNTGLYETEHVKGEESFNRSVNFLKMQFGFFKQLGKYKLHFGLLFGVIGVCLVILPSIFLKDYIRCEKNMLVEYYFGFIRGQLLVVGIILLILSALLIFSSRRK